MRFAHPYLLLLVPAFAAAGVWLYRESKKRAARRLAQFSPANRLSNVLRSVDYRAKARKAALFTSALCLLVVTLARPLWGPNSDPTEQTGAEFFVVLDVSKSMLVRDVAPNRLEAVKASLADWLKTRHGDRIGLILMAGDAFVQAPLTNDYTALREVLEQSSPASISLGGTNIPTAVNVVVKAMEASKAKNKAVIFISDGENLEGHLTNEIEQAHVASKISFFTIGVGTLEGGKVPEKDSKPDFTKPPKAYVKDDYGVTAHSRLDERSLRAIAAAGGGRYFAFRPDDNGELWNSLYTQGLSPLAKRSETFNLQQYDELFQIPLFLALALLVLEMSLSTRHQKPARPRSIVTLPEPAAAPTATTMPTRKTRSTSRARVPATTLLLLTLGAAAHGLSPSVQVIQQSETLMKAGKPAEAATLLRTASQTSPDDYFLVYNTGIASYAAGQYQDAIDAFNEASLSPDKKIRAQSLVQLGNAQFQLGKALLKNVNRTGASVALERAVESYESALAVKQTSMADNNLKVAKERLETVLMSLAETFLISAEKNTKTEGKITELTKAVTALERVTQINPKNTDAAQKLAKAKQALSEQLRDQARELRAKADAVTDPKKEKEQEKLNTTANESYQMAREQNPADKALEKEHEEFRKAASNALTDKAEQKMQQAMQPSEKNTMADMKKKQEALTDTLAKVEKALAFDEKNARAQALKDKALKSLEEALVASADMSKAAGDKQAQTQPEAAAGNFSDAMQNFQKALGINPDNAHAKDGLAKTEEALAKALTESGKKEMAQAAGQAAAPEKKGAAGKKKDANAAGKAPGEKPGEGQAGPKPPGEQNAAELRQNIGHLEKAAQSFAQADALRPGENDAQALQSEALNQLGQLRAALDVAQNKAANGRPGSEPGSEAPPGEGPPGQSEQPSDTPAKMAGGMNPVKPVLSFSDIRGGEAGDGLFRDLRQKSKIRDW